MAETLFYTYAPLIVWIGLGFFACRFLWVNLPRLLGRVLYWVGVPLQIIALTRRTDLTSSLGIAPMVTIGVFVVGFFIVWLASRVFGYSQSGKATMGSFFLSSLLGNTKSCYNKRL